jgi:hypothetical protein
MRRMTAICLLSTLLTCQACSNEIVNVRVPSATRTGENRNETQLDVNHVANTSIKNTKGLLVLSDRYSKDEFIRFYNDDGSLWYEFTFYYDDKDGKFEYENANFAPFAFHRDYFLLALKCTSEDKNRYEVIVNEETGLRKFVKKDDPTLKFQSWEDHVKGAFAVKFNQRENPLRGFPKDKVNSIGLPNDVTLHPVEVNGDWLKVRWDGLPDPKKAAGSGWVKWRDDNQILVELFYFA